MAKSIKIELNSNGVYDINALQQKKKPEIGLSGKYKKLDSMRESKISDITSILAEASNSYNKDLVFYVRSRSNHIRNGKFSY